MEQYLDFIKEAEGLKSVARSAWTAQGAHETTAEHSWRLALFALVLADEFPELDGRRVLELCLVHDLGELYDGDVSATLHPDEAQKAAAEQRAVQKLAALLPPAAAQRLTGMFAEYAAAVTPEAKLVKALDKAETIVQHNQGANQTSFDYAFNLEYGKQYFAGDARLCALRELIDRETAANLGQGE